MNRDDIRAKIRETEDAISRTSSWKCRRDLEKYLRRLNKELRRTAWNSK